MKIKKFGNFTAKTINESNMSYVRFENTYHDLQDCYDNMDEASSQREKEARRSLVGLCQAIVDEYGSTYGEESEIEEETEADDDNVAHDDDDQ